MKWEKCLDMGMPEGEMYIRGQYLYAGTADGVYRLLISAS